MEWRRAAFRVESDFRVGGLYTIYMLDASGQAGSCGGESAVKRAPHGDYLEIDPPRKLVFTWISEGFVDRSVVSVTLEPLVRGTLLTSRHELPRAVVEQHRHGWEACLGHLAESVG